MIRSLVLALVSLTWAHAIDLISIDSFATNEDTELIISYATLDGKCAVNGGPADRYRIADIDANGTVYSRATDSDSWALAVLGNYLAPGSSVRYVPNHNVFGTKGLISLRACLSSTESGISTANIVIAPQPDPPVATAATYSSVTEDTAFTFTHAILTTTLGISDPDLDAYTIKIVSRSAGTFDHAVGYQIPVGGSVTWTPPLNLYTKANEPDVPVLTVQAVSTVNKPQKTSAVVALKARITGVTDTLTGGTTMTSFDAIRMNPGTQTEYTYAQIHALAHGTNDVDRIGGFSFQVNNAAMNGITVTKVPAVGAIWTETINVTPPSVFFVGVNDGDVIRFVVPSTMPRGLVVVGDATLSVTSPASPNVPLQFNFNPPDNGTTSGGQGGSGGGGCGAGGTGILLLAMLGLMGLTRRWHAAS